MQTATPQKCWQMQQHDLTSKPGITLPDADVQDFVITLSSLYHTETYSLCPEEACSSSFYTHAKSQ